MTPERRYLPAASLDILLPAYDPIMKLLGFRRALLPLLAQAGLEPRHVVLDIGSGTGTLAILIKQKHPDVQVTGLDPDPLALARAARKTARAGVTVRFDRGFADAMPYADGTFDRVFSSMMFHHIPGDEKPRVLAEARRVLRPGGRLELLDFAGGTHSLLAHALHGRQAAAAAEDRLLRRMREAGFADARRLGTRGTIAGAISFYQATAPAAP
jgi:ubiquinone/menaquinone biosynthesis C-methylase UbiE